VAVTGLGFNLQYFMTTPSHDLEFYVRLERVAASTTDWAHAASEAWRNAMWPQVPPQWPTADLSGVA
jgi:hypothetical protein